jgi:iron(II)-dependent oxidoreductase
LTLPVPGEAGQLVPNPCPGRRYPWGPAWQEDCANTQEAGLEQTSAVGLFPAGASPYGVLDLVGNVWEWTRSRWGRNLARPDFRYPYGPEDGREDPESDAIPVLRGGSWFIGLRIARCAYRNGDLPDHGISDVGLRVVLSLVNSDS